MESTDGEGQAFIRCPIFATIWTRIRHMDKIGMRICEFIERKPQSLEHKKAFQRAEVAAKSTDGKLVTRKDNIIIEGASS